MKRLICVIFLFFLFWPLSSKEYDDHSNDIAGLFIDPAISKELYSQSRWMKMLNEAVYFALDYTSSENHQKNATTRMQDLAQLGIVTPMLENIATLGGPYHEKYSHLGWSYTEYDYDTMMKWARRKKLLIDVVNAIFDFSAFDEFLTANCTKIENQKLPYYYSLGDKLALAIGSKAYSMSAILYYTHILGDCEENSDSTNKTRMPLDEIKKELIHHLDKLFGREVNNYKQLKNVLNNPFSTASEVLKYLQGAMPGLLEDESFYKNSMLANDVARLLTN